MFGLCLVRPSKSPKRVRLILTIVNREEGLEGRQTSKAFALIGF